uniref:THAP domain-containing protein 1 n=1 Tax=Pundamilia nyererei TaxID=303518 RepID=A0A3B4H7U7_9CICH
MVRTCCVVGCNIRSHDREGKKLENGLSFHRFPSWRQREGSHAWIAAVRRADIEFSAIPNFLLACLRHFLSERCHLKMKLKRNIVTAINILKNLVLKVKKKLIVKND